MITDTSPATEARTPRRPLARPSPTTSTVEFGIPKSVEEAAKLLAHAERLARDIPTASDQVSQLTRFLGANSAAWTVENRARLRQVLASLGEAVIDPIVTAMSRLPRTDILDDGERVLRALPNSAAARLRRFLEDDIDPSVRTAILRAAARLDHAGSLAVVTTALNDSHAELRDAAASLLGELGSANNLVILEKRLEREKSEMVRASIREAIDSLQP